MTAILKLFDLALLPSRPGGKSGPGPARAGALGLILVFFLSFGVPVSGRSSIPPLPDGARLLLDEDWSSGEIDAETWYVPRRHWGGGNNGVVPENVRIATDTVRGRAQHVLVCRANGDAYTGPVAGRGGETSRVGGMVVSRNFFASGRFEIVMRVGPVTSPGNGEKVHRRPVGAVPAIWTYAYRFIEVRPASADRFVEDQPLYNPHMTRYNGPYNEYWSEIDFPEFGKNGDFSRAMYNTFLQNRHHSNEFDIGAAADGRYHTFTTEWRTELKPLPGVTDDDVVEHTGYWWIHDRTVPFEDYLGNPLTRTGEDSYSVHWGVKAEHWIDGRKVGENRRFVPAMAAQLSLGIWLPEWAGPAPWETAETVFASIRVWQYDDPGDVRGILTESVRDNFTPEGEPLDR